MEDLSTFTFNKKIFNVVTHTHTHISGVTLNNITPLNIFQLNVNFDKSTIRLHYLRIIFILARFQGDKD